MEAQVSILLPAGAWVAVRESETLNHLLNQFRRAAFCAAARERILRSMLAIPQDANWTAAGLGKDRMTVKSPGKRRMLPASTPDRR